MFVFTQQGSPVKERPNVPQGRDVRSSFMKTVPQFSPLQQPRLFLNGEPTRKKDVAYGT